MVRSEKAYLLEFFKLNPRNREAKCLTCGAYFRVENLGQLDLAATIHREKSPHCFGAVVVWNEVEVKG